MRFTPSLDPRGERRCRKVCGVRTAERSRDHAESADRRDHADLADSRGRADHADEGDHDGRGIRKGRGDHGGRHAAANAA